jgi:C_GCAxxG_C_C family probable redox protein
MSDHPRSGEPGGPPAAPAEDGDRAANPLPAADELAERAVELFETGLDCQEAVMRAFDEALDLGLMVDFEPVARKRAGLAASSICGALVGGTSVLLAALAEGDDRSANLTLDLLRGFRERHGTLACQYLTRQMPLTDYHAYCSRYVRSTVEGLHGILESNLGPAA